MLVYVILCFYVFIYLVALVVAVLNKRIYIYKRWIVFAEMVSYGLGLQLVELRLGLVVNIRFSSV